MALAGQIWICRSRKSYLSGQIWIDSHTCPERHICPEQYKYIDDCTYRGMQASRKEE